MRCIYGAIVCFLLFVCISLKSQSIQQSYAEQDSISKTYPVPPANNNMLFYIQRTHNTNTIVYDINLNKDQTINESEPVNVYWIRYADKGEIMPLSLIQRKFAYGVSSTLIDKEKKIFKIKLKAYGKREIFLMKHKSSNNYHAYIHINGTLSVLTNIFFKTDGGTFWSPNVVYIELTGSNITTGKVVVERFKPIVK